ncbi:MAG: phage/plasmid primase, P4 family [Candidatus Sedimenticola sp. (ex Thyasira tokunagai)]
MRRRSRKTNPLYESVMHYVKDGYPVIALAPGTKIPTAGSSGYKDASTSESKIKEWWDENPTANIGIATGDVSGLVVIDVDVKNGIDGNVSYSELNDKYNIPDTRIAKTPSGGKHYYFFLPEGNMLRNRTGALPGIDVRGTGGYIVAPPSKNADGKYEWIDESVDIADMPDDLIEYFNQKDGVDKDHDTHSIDNPLDGVPEGQRNDALFRYACRLRSKSLSKEEARKLVIKAAKRCTPPFSKEEAKKCLKSAWKYNPTFDLTEVGNAERLVHFNQDNLRYLVNTGWMVWSDTAQRWIIDDSMAKNITIDVLKMIRQDKERAKDDVHRKQVEQHYKRSQTVRVMNDTLKIARINPNVRITNSDIDSDPHLLQVNNGVINLSMGRLEESKPEAYITKQVPINYDQNALCPQFMDFLQAIFQGDANLISYVKRAVGYTLTADIGEQCIFLMYGEGANGKSVLQNIITQLTGDYGIAAPPQMLTQKTRSSTNDLARLEGRRLLTLSEESAGAELDEALIKQLTGGDVISARELYKEFSDFTVKAKFWMSTNHLPRVKGKDHAIWRRIKVIPFNYRVSSEEVDQGLLKKLRNELPGILNWAIEGCREWQDEGLNSCEAVNEATAQYRNNTDTVDNWLTAKTYNGEVVSSKASDLYEDYKQYTGSTGYELSQTMFGKYLSNVGYNRIRKSNGNYYEGIGLKSSGSSRRRRRKR